MFDTFEYIKEKGFKKIAIMGGTFDPVHFGHLITAETVRIEQNFEAVIFIPSGIPPHKIKMNITHGCHRYNMLKLAVSSNPYFMVSRIELDREGNTYTIDTISDINRKLNYKTEVYFITGADAILEIPTWKDPARLLSTCKFIAVSRPGYDRNKLCSGIDALKVKYSCSIEIVDVPAFDISSTQIREKIVSEKSIRYFVPESVEQYIMDNNLYRRPE